MVLLDGCTLDSFDFHVENRSSVPVAVEAPGVMDLGILRPGASKRATAKDKSSSFRVLILKDSTVTEYGFGDVDHWFGTTHDVHITIADKGNTLTTSGSARFVEIGQKP